MKYTRYFSKSLSAQGTPHLSPDAFKVYMNIVALESKIEGMEKCKKLNLAYPGHIDFQIDRIKDQVESITGGRTPEEQMRRLVS
jgi:hypothetical protein